MYTACQPIDLVVEYLSSDANDIGLQRQAVIDAAESRLRSARIYDPDASDYLYVDISVVGSAFHVGLEFNRKVFDFHTGNFGLATTWNTSGTGTHGRDPQYILGILSGFLDSFPIEFLRVNEPACDDAK